ncbi:uncharacterized protein LOC108917866 [Anoplophora glabripennis]|uniref:uncharacterized protein LOC108917866 n=1 Tax=Anoplophora glabripennis TaxID=217634 RepID=UPI0008735996|nr:uncharacterized protein LOC108917866 [Anoplophora glabripennis]XP_018580168.1 uncharacterized protein LOC108917866 [Anoplophora glabripennis]
MGDNKTNETEKEKLSDQQSESGSSLKPLRSVRPSENIAILDEPSPPSEEKVQRVQEQVLEPADSEAKVETVFEKPLELVQETKSEVDRLEADIKVEPPSDDVKTSEEVPKDKPLPTNLEKKCRLGSATSGLIQSERIIRNQSDIFSLKEQTSIASAIFSVNGSPSRKVFRRRETAASNVFPFGQAANGEPPLEKVTAARERVKDAKETYNELTRPSGSARNPLTGTGLTSNDEYKFKGSKRKDGNPLLGVGYSPEATPSTHRIPPGGFSHKLW